LREREMKGESQNERKGGEFSENSRKMPGKSIFPRSLQTLDLS
jgi:hypothetical protein